MGCHDTFLPVSPQAIRANWSTPENYSATIVWTLSGDDGSKTVYAKFKDTVGNWSNVFSDTIILDTTPPITTANPEGGNYISNQNVTLTANEPATIYYTTDGTTPALTSNIYSTPIVVTTSLILKIFALDSAGNSEALKSEIYTLDITAPNPPIVSGTSPTTNPKPTWTWVLGGGGGHGTFRYRLDNNDLTTGATETTVLSYTPATELTEGQHILYVQERDTAGNWSNSGSFTIIIQGFILAAGNIGLVQGETKEAGIILTSLEGFNYEVTLTYGYVGITPPDAIVSIAPKTLVPPALTNVISHSMYQGS